MNEHEIIQMQIFSKYIPQKAMSAWTGSILAAAKARLSLLLIRQEVLVFTFFL